jgi:membrane-associated phospholipid phosphatase
VNRSRFIQLRASAAAALLGVAALAFASVARAGDPAAPDSARSMTTVQRASDAVRRDLHELASQRSLVILATGGATAGLCTTFEDPDRADAALDGSVWEGVANVGNVWGNGFFQAAGAGVLLVAGGLSKDPNLSLAGTEAARALAYAGGAAMVLKYTFNRTRPDGTQYSFPSGHCAMAFAVAPVFTERFGWRAGVPAYALAIVTAIGRIEDRRHYLSDCVFGAALGLTSGTAVIASDRGAGREHVAIDSRGIEFVLRF